MDLNLPAPAYIAPTTTSTTSGSPTTIPARFRTSTISIGTTAGKSPPSTTRGINKPSGADNKISPQGASGASNEGRTGVNYSTNEANIEKPQNVDTKFSDSH